MTSCRAQILLKLFSPQATGRVSDSHCCPKDLDTKIKSSVEPEEGREDILMQSFETQGTEIPRGPGAYSGITQDSRAEE